MKASTPATTELHDLMFEMWRRMKRLITQDGAVCSLLHIETLRFVEEAKSPSMRELADHLRVTAPSATALTEGLVNEGYLLRRPDAKDRRLIRLAVSAKGKRLIKDAYRRRVDAFASVIARLSPLDRAELTRILRVIAHD